MTKFYQKNPDYLAYKFASREGATVFHLSCALSDFERLNFFMNIDASGVHWEDQHKMTPIFYAVKQNKLEMLKHLISLKVDINHLDNKISNPLYLSVLYSNFEVFKLLVDSGANVNHQNKYMRNPLMKAIYLCSVDKTNYLLNHPQIDINLKDFKERTVLHMACWGNEGGRKGKIVQKKTLNDFSEIIPDLIKLGAKVDLKDRDGNSALMISCSTNSLNSLKYWHENGYSFDHVNNYQETPFTITIKYTNLGRCSIQSN